MATTGDAGAPIGAPLRVEAKIAAALERLGQVQRVLLQAAATANGLSPIQARIVVRLAVSPTRGHHPAALAAEFGVTRATVADALTALIRKDLIDRQKVAGDGRRVSLALTPEGHEVAGAIAGWSAPVETELAALPPEAATALLGTLLRLIEALQRAGLVSTSRMCLTCRFFRKEAHPRSSSPHHCMLLDAALAERELRIDCPEHQESA